MKNPVLKRGGYSAAPGDYTLRDKIAIAAMQSFVSSETIMQSDERRLKDFEYAAKTSYEMADAMLKQREL